MLSAIKVLRRGHVVAIIAVRGDWVQLVGVGWLPYANLAPSTLRDSSVPDNAPR